MPQFEQLERPRFFTGQLLSAEDFRQEQDYFRGRACRHNRLLHGWGIASGLSVSLDGDATVTVAPGMALDCAGNELVLPASGQLSLSGLSGRLYVTIRFTETLVAPLPTTQGGTEFSRVREAVCVETGCANPGAGHSGMGPGSPGCGEPHAVCLATLRQRGSHWHVTPAKRSILRRR